MVVSLVSDVALFSGQQDVSFFDLEGIINSVVSVLRLLIVSRVDININISIIISARARSCAVPIPIPVSVLLTIHQEMLFTLYAIFFVY